MHLLDQAEIFCRSSAGGPGAVGFRREKWLVRDGIVAGWFTARGGTDQSLRLFLTTGIIGGFTTCSTFSLDYAFLWKGGHALAALLYVGGSLVLGIGALFIGLALARFM